MKVIGSELSKVRGLTALSLHPNMDQETPEVGN
jgi:hypothetical protein